MKCSQTLSFEISKKTYWKNQIPKPLSVYSHAVIPSILAQTSSKYIVTRKSLSS